MSAEEAEQLQEVLQEGEGSMPVEELAGRLEASHCLGMAGVGLGGVLGAWGVRVWCVDVEPVL